MPLAQRRPSIQSRDGRLYHGTASTKEELKHIAQLLRNEAPDYFRGLAPSLSWLPKYQRAWLSGDLIAGITVGVMVVPQSLAFATLAGLPVQYGMYTVFMSVIIYAFTGTCREVAVGPAAVISLLMGEAIHRLKDGSGMQDYEIGAALNLMMAITALIMGSFRLGFLLDLIPNPVIMGFTTGTAFIIMASQISSLFGVPKGDSSDSIETVIHFFTHLEDLKWQDLVFGLSSFFCIVVLNFGCARLMKRIPAFRYLKISANAITVIMFTLLSFLLIKFAEFPLTVGAQVPAGIAPFAAPKLSFDFIGKAWGSALPILVIGMMEHVSICKAFSRKSGYQISSSQELLSLGLANTVTSFFGGYLAVGSFPTSAVNSQSGVRTPLGGIFTGVIVTLAMLFLTPAFSYIPTATLSAIIFFAAIHLVHGPHLIVDLWKVHPIDCIVFLLAALATFFLGAEIGIGASMGLSFLSLLYRIARPRFYILEQVLGRRDVFIDINHPGYETENPLPGVIVFRLQESLIFPNIDFVRDSLIDACVEITRSGAAPVAAKDRLWADDLTLRGEKLRLRRSRLTKKPAVDASSLPLLHGVVFDFGSVNLIDSSGLQGLFDLRDTLLRYSGATYESSNSDVFDPSLEPEEDVESQVPAFEMHFVSTHPHVLKVLEVSGITDPVAPIIPSEIRRQLETNGSTATQQRIQYTIEPIIANPSRYVHLTVHDALKRIRRHLAQKSEKPSRVTSSSTPFATTFTPQ
ncbi:hypothetical protein DSO57_1012340 [Entomophthora muscae]|uniref:Uncharacterized protein n=1 Tax=Entomophthora muscae TaxID=34485 RepID=A0ACC2SV42_9FUNG|nr:hypothetical protein DSO57_1012340 [Entomophthora muscae]